MPNDGDGIEIRLRLWPRLVVPRYWVMLDGKRQSFFYEWNPETGDYELLELVPVIEDHDPGDEHP